MKLFPIRLRQTAEELAHRASAKVEQLAWRYAARTGDGFWQLARNRRPDTTEFPDLPVTVWSDWTVQAIKMADSNHILGNFARSSTLCESMQADDRVQSALNGRIKGITKCALTMTPAEDGDKQTAANVAKELEELWPELMPLERIEQIQTWTILMGFCLGELVWEFKEKLWIPRVKVWHPLFIYYRIDIRRYIAITMEGTLEIEPNDPKWMLFTPYDAYRGWMRGAVRSIAIPWVVRQFALRDWARFSEKHGLPIVVNKMAAAKSAEDKARFFRQIQALGSETSLTLPEGWDVTLLEARDTSWESFRGLIDQCDRSITLAIRGTNLTTEVGKAGGGGGSNAAAQTHREEDSDYAEADVRKFGQCIKLQIFGPYCLYNHGDARLAPTPVLEAKPQEDKTAKANTLVAVSTAITALETTGWPIDRQKTAEEFGINLKEGAGDGTLNPTTPDQGGEPTPKRPDLPTGDDESKMPGAEGQKGDNKVDPTVATRLTRDEKAAWHREKARQHEQLSLAFAGSEPGSVELARGQATTDGQKYIDRVVEVSKAAAVPVLRSRIDEVMAEARKAGGFEAMKDKLARMAREAKRSKLKSVVQGALQVSELAGRHAVQLETERRQEKLSVVDAPAEAPGNWGLSFNPDGSVQLVWDDAAHPRGPDGRFISGGGGGKAAPKKSPGGVGARVKSPAPAPARAKAPAKPPAPAKGKAAAAKPKKQLPPAKQAKRDQALKARAERDKARAEAKKAADAKRAEKAQAVAQKRKAVADAKAAKAAEKAKSAQERDAKRKAAAEAKAKRQAARRGKNKSELDDANARIREKAMAERDEREQKLAVRQAEMHKVVKPEKAAALADSLDKAIATSEPIHLLPKELKHTARSLLEGVGVKLHADPDSSDALIQNSTLQPHVGGECSWNGGISLSPATVGKMQRSFRDISEGKLSDYAYGIKSLVHEEAHRNSPSRSPGGYHGIGVIVEEAGAAMIEKAAVHHLTSQPDRYVTKSFSGEEGYYFGDTGYHRHMKAMAEAIRPHVGGTVRSASEALEKAYISMWSDKPSQPLDTPEKMVDHFVKHVPTKDKEAVKARIMAINVDEVIG